IIGGDWPKPANAKIYRLKASLHGSLAYTGIGHATDRAVILGLCGYRPDTIDPDIMDAEVARVAAEKTVQPEGHPAYHFDPKTDLVMDRKTPLPGHANGMAFEAYDRDDRLLLRRAYFSIGGGFVVTAEELSRVQTSGNKVDNGANVPYPFRNAAEMLEMAHASGLSIAEMKRANEECCMARVDLDQRPGPIWARCAIALSVAQPRWCHAGRVEVRRRARQLHDKLQEDWRNNRSNSAARQ
ncbi:serine dehydratase beta chain, partial [Brucella abortus]|nr:serine dehydratase beta chain [Brucella abortus]